MKARKITGALLAAVILNCILAAPPALAAPSPVAAPAWSIQSAAMPTDFKPGDEGGKDSYLLFITNSGGEVTDRSQVIVTDTLPIGLNVEKVELFSPREENEPFDESVCHTAVAGAVSTVTCNVTEVLQHEPAKLYPGNQLRLTIDVAVAPTASGTLVNKVQVSGGGAKEAVTEFRNQATAEEARAGLEEFKTEQTGRDGLPATGADSHPYQYTTSFSLNQNPSLPGVDAPFLPAGGSLKELEVALPPGLIGNPTAIERCSPQQFNTIVSEFHNQCPPGSVVGQVALQVLEGRSTSDLAPLYNLVPPKGMPAQLGFEVLAAPIYIDTKLRTGSDYGVTTYLHNVTEAERISVSRVTIWGTPWDKSHDRVRGGCGAEVNPEKEPCSVEGTPRPFLRAPSSCENSPFATISIESWVRPPASASESSTEPAPTACNQPPFTPTIEAKPTTNVADSPTGLHVHLHLPQEENEEPEGIAEADLRDATVTLPPGLSVNPSSANGLGACSEQDIGYEGEREGRQTFSPAAANCPVSAKIGSVEVDTPLVDHPLPGSIYLAKQSENPFGSLLALYLTVSDPQTGVVVKLPGKVSVDPLTGQITNTFEQNPQVPFEDLKVDLFEGARAPLRTPATCGESPTTPSFTTTTSLTPWTAPASGPPATPSDSFQIEHAPAGGACATSKSALPNSPSFEAGTENPLAGAYSPFILKLSRPDGSQELTGLNLTLPAGLSARLAGTPECSAAGVAQALSRTNPGEGAAELQSPSCPAASQLGTVTVGAGAGPTPFYAQGKAYLAGPYKGAPLSMLIITPAVAGPFDLGSVAVRAALYLNPETAQVTVRSDPIPTIEQGIPLDVRSIAVKIDKPDFTLNPTSCEAKAITGEAISTQGQAAALNNRFQVGGCQNLGFHPNLALKLKGPTKRAKNPALTATLTYPKGSYANIKSAQVTLPHSEFLEQAHIKTVCTRPELASHTCPAASIYGSATAETPLLDKPLSGPVYLGVGFGHKLPDLVADLNGQIEVLLNGKVDTGKGNGLRNTFEVVPDAPVSKFTLSLFGGKKGLIVNSEDLCGPQAKTKAIADFTAQNGKVFDTTPVVANGCGGGAKKGKHAKKHGRNSTG
jgi:hypothetical protein